MKQLEQGDTIEVGDIIRSDSWAGIHEFPVHRVTKTVAFYMCNSVCVRKVKRMIGRINDGVTSIPEADVYSQVRVIALRPDCNKPTLNATKLEGEL